MNRPPAAMPRVMVPIMLVLTSLLFFAALAAAWPSLAQAKTIWLCKPGKASDPCSTSLRTTLISPTGKVIGRITPRPVRNPRIDCFYLYPTVSTQTTRNSNLKVEPAQRAIARMQAARYSQYCRVFAPMYRQQTLPALESAVPITPEETRIAYRSALAGWKLYMRRYNRGRGFVLIGHSQGSEVLRELISRVIDPSPRLRARMLSALLLGGNVEVREGRGIGGDFNSIPACRSPRQLSCVVAFSTFNGPVPADSAYGRVNGPFNPGDPLISDVLCTNPAAPGGGIAPIDTIYRSGFDISLAFTGLPQRRVKTPWVEMRGGYRARCASGGDADVLQIRSRRGAPVLNPLPDPTWGLHVTDANIALGNLLDLVRTQISSYSGG
jgi:hypothetical protein